MSTLWNDFNTVHKDVQHTEKTHTRNAGTDYNCRQFFVAHGPAVASLLQRVADEGLTLYYIHHNGHSVFVKDAAIFTQQGGLTDEWGRAWKPVWARNEGEARLLW